MIMNTKDLHDKYFELVWFAKRLPDDYENPNIKKLINEIIEKYPKETTELQDENSNYYHGFNSGMLACLRLVSCARIYPDNLEEFPCLDT